MLCIEMSLWRRSCLVSGQTAFCASLWPGWSHYLGIVSTYTNPPCEGHNCPNCVLLMGVMIMGQGCTGTARTLLKKASFYDWHIKYACYFYKLYVQSYIANTCSQSAYVLRFEHLKIKPNNLWTSVLTLWISYLKENNASPWQRSVD
jgi:hypothetical protein